MKNVTSCLIIVVMASMELSCDRRPGMADHAESYASEVAAVALNVKEEESVARKAGDVVNPDRRVIRRGNLDFATENLGETREQVEAICLQYKAYISSESRTNYERRSQYAQEIRVPAEHFDALVKQIEGLGRRIESKSVTSEDVTEEFIDVEARLKTKHELENRYRALLKQAKTVSDMVAIENQIGNVRAEIESMQGRLNYLKSQVAYSTLNIVFHENTGTGSAFASKLADAVTNGWQALLLLIVGLMSTWPFLLLTAVACWFFPRRKKRLARQPETLPE